MIGCRVTANHPGTIFHGLAGTVVDSRDEGKGSSVLIEWDKRPIQCAAGRNWFAPGQYEVIDDRKAA